MVLSLLNVSLLWHSRGTKCPSSARLTRRRWTSSCWTSSGRALRRSSCLDTSAPCSHSAPRSSHTGWPSNCTDLLDTLNLGTLVRLCCHVQVSRYSPSNPPTLCFLVEIKTQQPMLCRESRIWLSNSVTWLIVCHCRMTVWITVSLKSVDSGTFDNQKVALSSLTALAQTGDVIPDYSLTNILTKFSIQILKTKEKKILECHHKWQRLYGSISH